MDDEIELLTKQQKKLMLKQMNKMTKHFDILLNHLKDTNEKLTQDKLDSLTTYLVLKEFPTLREETEVKIQK